MNPRELEEIKSNAENVLRGELEKLQKMKSDLNTAVEAIQATLSKAELLKNNIFYKQSRGPKTSYDELGVARPNCG